MAANKSSAGTGSAPAATRGQAAEPTAGRPAATPLATSLIPAAGKALGRAPYVRSAEADASDPGAMRRIAKALGPGPFSTVLLFFSYAVSRASLAMQLQSEFPKARIMGCSTAGELSSAGYDEGKIVAMGFPADHFGVETLLVPNLQALAPQDLMGGLIRARQNLMRRYPTFTHEFAFLLVDGLSTREDQLTAALASGLGAVPLFGGSAGDGDRFEETFVLNGHQMIQNAAVLTFFRTDCPVKVFSYDHFQATETRMVVTRADPERRVVKEINAEPAAHEYARLIGMDPALLDDHVFAANPVVVRVGGKHHVRSIKSVGENGEMTFFAAIDEGVVLTLARPDNMIDHLSKALTDLSARGDPAAILACDCVFRKVEAEMSQKKSGISDLLARHNVRGFSTYGEQIGAIHVNQTFTGVAIYPPGSGPER